MAIAIGRWTHDSVQQFAGEADPVDAILSRARSVVLEAMDQGWSGPPFDPIELADLLDIEVMAAEGVRDARIIQMESGQFRVEFNPFRSDARIRYNLAHEIVHTFFEDCGDAIRHRASRKEIEGDDWQLEALCNIGAAEILMPVGVFSPMRSEEVTASALLRIRESFAVSTETVAIRLAELSEDPIAAFAASRIERSRHRGRYRLDYIVPSSSWPIPRIRGSLLPEDTLLRECAAIGYTNNGVEEWEPLGEATALDVIAIPPYPGRVSPRAVGLVRPSGPVEASAHGLKFVQGDALEPHGEDPRIVAHIVNDTTPRWGGGFALEVRKRYASVQDFFIGEIEQIPDRLALGNTVFAEASPGLDVANMVAQKGYLPTGGRLVRYSALRTCLDAVAHEAARRGATVHMPRIGVGQGGGEWTVVEDLIRVTLGAAGVSVTVYDLPGREHFDQQTSLGLGL